MAHLEEVARYLADAGVVGELWVNGSFVTEKIDPRDVDVLLRVSAAFYQNACPEQRAAIDWITSNLSGSHKCDSYVLVEYPIGHPLYSEGEWERAYWIAQFGWSRDSDMKGIAVIKIPSAVT